MSMICIGCETEFKRKPSRLYWCSEVCRLSSVSWCLILPDGPQPIGGKVALTTEAKFHRPRDKPKGRPLSPRGTANNQTAAISRAAQRAVAA